MTTSLPTNGNSQRTRIIDYLQTHDTGLNRYEADKLLNVCQFPARIFELKALGHVFLTITETAEDLNGRIHHDIVRHFWREFKPFIMENS
ncbi:MAG: helix-turn-helix domain-containing protein [Legionellales bacterium]